MSKKKRKWIQKERKWIQKEQTRKRGKCRKVNKMLHDNKEQEMNTRVKKGRKVAGKRSAVAKKE